MGNRHRKYHFSKKKLAEIKILRKNYFKKQIYVAIFYKKKDATTISKTITMATQRICLWSSPRSLSTGLMYSFAQRSDTKAIDEPLFGYYAQHTGVTLAKGTHEAVSHMEKDGEKIIKETFLGTYEESIVFIKSLANQLVGLDRSFLKETKNIFLVRDPSEIINAYAKFLEKPTSQHIGVKAVYDLYQELSKQGAAVTLITYKNLLSNPPAILAALCDKLEIPFDSSMLSWPAGPKPEDGGWADTWYNTLHKSTGFKTYEPKEILLPPHLKALVAENQAYYQYLESISL